MIGCFIDGAYLDLRWKALAPHRALDYRQLREKLEDALGDHIEEAYYYDANLRSDHPRKRDAILRAGFRVKDNYRIAERSLRTIAGDDVRVRMQKGVDVGLAVGMLRSHERCRWNRLILIAGDADFAEVVQSLTEDHAVEVTVVGSESAISLESLVWAQRTLYLETLAHAIASGTTVTYLARPQP